MFDLCSPELHGRLLSLRIPDKAGFLFLRRCLVSYLMHFKANPVTGVRETEMDLWTVDYPEYLIQGSRYRKKRGFEIQCFLACAGL